MCRQTKNKNLAALALVLGIVVVVVIGSVTFYNLSRINQFQLSLVHVNDFHDRFEEINVNSNNTCKGKYCIGGFARLYHAINNLKDAKNFVLLNAGDNFFGTAWYYTFKWNVTSFFMNKLPFDAFTLGNQELDANISGLVPYLRSLKAPMVVSNIVDKDEPSLQGLYSKSTIIERDGYKIGIIGVILKETAIISTVEKLHFTDEIAAINSEAFELEKEGVFTIIVLAHCGYHLEKKIAENVGRKVSVIVGGHSHTFLYTGESPCDYEPEGPYPTIIKRRIDGEKVLVLQASAFTWFLGNITIYYDKWGSAQHWDGKPIFLDSNVPQDEDVLKEMKSWKEIVDETGKNIIGSSETDLILTNCTEESCLLGNFFADAMVEAHKENDPVAILDPVNIRATIEKGNITYADLIACWPYRNTLDLIEIRGEYLKHAFEYGSTEIHRFGTTVATRKILQVSSAVRVSFDLRKPLKERLQFVKINSQDLEEDKIYKVVVLSFMRRGLDGFTMISRHIKNVKIGPVDVDFFSKHIANVSPIQIPNKESRSIIIT